MPLQRGYSARTPLPPDGPYIQFADRNKRKRNGFSFDERAIELASAVPGLAQERENVGIMKDGIHSDFPLTAALVGFFYELIDVLRFGPRPRHLLRILHGTNPLYIRQFLQGGRRKKLPRKSAPPVCRIWLGAFCLSHLSHTLASRYFRHRSTSRSLHYHSHASTIVMTVGTLSLRLGRAHRTVSPIPFLTNPLPFRYNSSVYHCASLPARLFFLWHSQSWLCSCFESKL